VEEQWAIPEGQRQRYRLMPVVWGRVEQTARYEVPILCEVLGLPPKT
jgi:hypothetical protein